MKNKSCDFLVIGGGIAGASAACALSSHGKTLIAEREDTPDHHTTGRSAATLTRAYENPLVSTLISASVPFLETAHETGFSPTPILSPRGTLCIASEDRLEELDQFYKKFLPSVESLQRLSRQETLALPTAKILKPEIIGGSVLEPDARDIDVHALHQAYLKTLKNNGGALLLNTEILSLRYESGLWHAQTPQGTIEAKTLINAAGAWADDIAKLAGGQPIGLEPKRRTIITFRDLPEELNTDEFMFTHDIQHSFYFRPEGHGQLLASPADEIPSPPCDAQPEEIDIATAAYHVEEALTFPIRAIAHKWAGLRSFAPDRLPVAGFDDDIPNFFWLAGQGGAGIKTAPALSRIVESLIVSRTIPKDLIARGLTKDALSPLRLKA